MGRCRAPVGSRGGYPASDQSMLASSSMLEELGQGASHKYKTGWGSLGRKRPIKEDCKDRGWCRKRDHSERKGSFYGELSAPQLGPCRAAGKHPHLAGSWFIPEERGVLGAAPAMQLAELSLWVERWVGAEQGRGSTLDPCPDRGGTRNQDWIKMASQKRKLQKLPLGKPRSPRFFYFLGWFFFSGLDTCSFFLSF